MSLRPDFQVADLLCPCCGGGGDIVKAELIAKLNQVQQDCPYLISIASGYRCQKHNAEVGGVPNSAHLTGQAADISDMDGLIKTWMTVGRLEHFGLWAEQYSHTPTWAHWQVRAAKNRIFVP